MEEFTAAVDMTLTVMLGICLVAVGALLVTLLTDARTYYQVRGIRHCNKWTYTIDKGIRFGKPNDNTYEKNYLEVWFRTKDQAEAYLMTLELQNENRTFTLQAEEPQS